jgi:S1-C subfamily serine protease
VVLGNGLEDGGVASFVVTNAHVVSPRGDEKPTFVVLIDLPTGDTQEFGARVLASGKVPDSDLAILSVPGLALDPVRLADDEELSVGDDIFVVAAPYGRSLSVSGGMVSQVDLDRDSPHRPVMIKTDAAIGYGASGGGMFSAETGKLLGIVEGYRTAKVSIPVATDTYSFDVPMPGETFAAPAAKIRRFLEQKGLSRVLGAARSASPVAAAN